MNETEISIRLAVLQDLEKLTDLHCASFKPEEHVPVMLGRRYVRATYRWHIESPEAYVVVAEVGNKIVGLVGMCDRSFFKPMFMACLGELFLSIIMKPGLIFKKEFWNRVFRQTHLSKKADVISTYPGMAQMTIGAVDSNYRGINIFPELVQATKVFSKNRGSRAIRAGVYKINTASRRVFIKSGWIETPELETNDTVFYIAYLDPTLPEELGLST
jgi:ribosomal protein S18 acetylase RimI-like enzyme